MKKILLIDGNSLLFRSYYATATHGFIMRSFNNKPTNAVYGFANTLHSYIQKNEYKDIIVAFDKGKKTFRHKKLENYKKGRKKTPEELISQFSLIREYLKNINIKFYELDEYEADDIIGTIAQKANQEGMFVDILTSDKDLLQLVNKQTEIISPKPNNPFFRYTEETIYDKWNITPEQITDLKGLMGDPSDNLKGIPNVGEKTAVKILSKYKTVDNLFSNLVQVQKEDPSIYKKIYEYKEDALFYKEIATLTIDIKHKFIIDEELKFNHNNAYNFYIKYNMNSLAKKILSNYDIQQDNNNKIIQYNINNWEIKYEAKENYIYLINDTSNYHRANFHGIGILNENGFFYIEKENILRDKSFILFLSNKNNNFITYNMKRLIVTLYKENIYIDGITLDIQLISYLYNTSLKDDITVTAGIFNQTNPILETNDEFYKDFKNKNLEKITNYAFLVCKAIMECDKKACLFLEENNLYDLYMLDMKTSKLLSEIEIYGIMIDQLELQKQSVYINAEIKKLEEEIAVYTKNKINPQSPKQLKEFLFNDLKLKDYKKGSTSQEALNLIKDEHPIINLLIKFRKMSKLFSTYIKGLEKYIFPDSKIHTIFNNTLTNTGRLSSIEPNIQNIAAKNDTQKEIRKVFIASSDDYELISLDYSQIELRILAHMSNDKKMISAFNHNIDIHTQTAANIFNIDLKNVNEKQRRIAKGVNFGIIYGISSFGLANNINIEIKEAKEIINKYFEQFPTIKSFLDSQVDKATKKGYISTIYNRRRYINELQNSNKMVQKFGKRIAMNSPIQGSASDIMKDCMVKIQEFIENNNFDIKMIAQIHDEIIFEVLKKDIPKLKDNLINIMENVVKLKIPLKVDYKKGQNFFELK